jgi:small subunit ribosomal protein S17
MEKEKQVGKFGNGRDEQDLAGARQVGQVGAGIGQEKQGRAEQAGQVGKAGDEEGKVGKGEDVKGKDGMEGKDEECGDKKCPFHGSLSVRGRNFIGKVIRKKEKNVTIEIERFVYYPKYERYAKKKTKIHAYLPSCLAKKIEIGDIIKIGECRPLAKTIHHVVIALIKKSEKKEILETKEKLEERKTEERAKKKKGEKEKNEEEAEKK